MNIDKPVPVDIPGNIYMYMNWHPLRELLTYCRMFILLAGRLNEADWITLLITQAE